MEQEYQAMAALIPEASVQMFDHGGHPAIASNAEQAAQAIRRWLLEGQDTII